MFGYMSINRSTIRGGDWPSLSVDITFDFDTSVGVSLLLIFSLPFVSHSLRTVHYLPDAVMVGFGDVIG
jgi:hypothetical protein